MDGPVSYLGLKLLNVRFLGSAFLRLGLFKVTLVRFGSDYLGFMILKSHYNS